MIQRLAFLLFFPILALGNPPLVKEMKPGVFYIEDGEGGLEEFGISESTWNVYQDEDGTWEFTVLVKTDKDIKRLESKKEVFGNSKPGFESTAILKSTETVLKIGQIIAQREAYDRKRSFNLSSFYYGGNGSLENLRIEILEVNENILDIKLTGLYDGDDAKVALRTKLKKDPKLKRSLY